MEWTKENYTLSTDPSRLDLRAIHAFLTAESYWAKGIALEVVQKSIEHSLNFGLYIGEQQVGFARVITDYATFAYLADVFILKEHRGRGLSKWLIERILGYPELQGLRRWALFTRDAHSLYARYGFRPMPDPSRYLEVVKPKL